MESVFSEIPQFVIHNVDKLESKLGVASLGIWIYMFSFGCNAEFKRKELIEHFKSYIGEKKMNKILKLLKDNYLIEMIQSKDNLGKFDASFMMAKNGKEFFEKVVLKKTDFD